jgi:o-succinylbenzoate synthase
LKLSYKKHILNFKFEAGTSRGILKNHTVYFLKIENPEDSKHFGLGEAAPLEGLSIDFLPNIEAIIDTICKQFSAFGTFGFEDIYRLIPASLPSIKFALETALLDYKYGGNRKIFSNSFSEKTEPININGLIWMADKDLMLSRIHEKIKEGYTTLKLKVGAIDFNDELTLLSTIRNDFPNKDLTIRLDANGAFENTDALGKLEKLASFDIHSIEQPIKAGQRYAMKEVIKNSPIPIALDEEMIGIFGQEKFKLLALLKPQFIVLKPTLLGGFEATSEWIKYADNLQIRWWITSALESNIGLNAIAQYCGEFNNDLPQGLGTGQLYENNIESPLKIENGKLYYDQKMNWNLAFTS